MIQKILSHNIVRYILVGGVSYLIEIGLILFLTYTLHIHAVASVAIAFWVGLVVSFALQKIVAFGDTSSSAKRLTIQTIQYSALVGINYTFTLLFVWSTTNFMGVFFARTAALIITTIWNYVIYSKVIFKKK